MLRDVHGPVQTGSGRQYYAGRDQYNAGRDIDNSVRVTNDYDPADEIFMGKGIGRLLAVVGILAALGGFAVCADAVFGVWQLAGSGVDLSGSPLMRPWVHGLPMFPAGFGLFVVGGLVASIGVGMSKAARRRAERRRMERRRGSW